MAFKKILTPSFIGLAFGVIIGVLGETGLIGRSIAGGSGMIIIAIFAITIWLMAGIKKCFFQTFFFAMGMMLGVVAADFAIEIGVLALFGTMYLIFRV